VAIYNYEFMLGSACLFFLGGGHGVFPVSAAIMNRVFR